MITPDPTPARISEQIASDAVNTALTILGLAAGNVKKACAKIGFPWKEPTDDSVGGLYGENWTAVYKMTGMILAGEVERLREVESGLRGLDMQNERIIAAEKARADAAEKNLEIAKAVIALGNDDAPDNWRERLVAFTHYGIYHYQASGMSERDVMLDAQTALKRLNAAEKRVAELEKELDNVRKRIETLIEYNQSWENRCKEVESRASSAELLAERYRTALEKLQKWSADLWESALSLRKHTIEAKQMYNIDGSALVENLDEVLKLMPVALATPAAPASTERITFGEQSDGTFVLPLHVPSKLHPDTKSLVMRFAEALADKLHKAELKYGYSDGWRSGHWMDECREKLRHHLEKGDPRDVAAYCAFLWHHGASTAAATPTEEKYPRCTKLLMAKGVPYPRTCEECGLGPCKRNAAADGKGQGAT